jgi:hypothetical protein
MNLIKINNVKSYIFKLIIFLLYYLIFKLFLKMEAL